MNDLHTPRVVGLDLSLTGTGVAVIEGRSIATGVFGATGHNDATLVDRHKRLNRLVDQIMYQVAPGMTRPDLVVIEGPSYSTVGGHTHDRSGLWWLVIERLFDLGLPVLEVRPNLRCKYATGKGVAPKNQVVIAVTRRYPEVEFDNDNEADALVLAAMGRRLLDHPIEESMPQTHLESLKTLRLPELSDAQQAERAPLSEMQAKLAALRKKDTRLRVGSLADFDMNSHDSFSTGNLSLDNATGVRGFPRGRVIELYGPTMSGKTTSALQAAGIHQQRVQNGLDTGAILFLDYERSLDEHYCAALGLDVFDAETFIYAQPESFEQGANLFRELLGDGYLALGIADSVAAMVSEKELAAATGANTMADRAKALHQFMRQTTGALHRQRTTLIMLNHVMDLIDTSPMGQRMAAQGIRRKTTPGGTALPFYASMRIEYTQVDTHKSTVHNVITDEDEEIVNATTVQAKVVKNKVSKPQRIARMRVRYGLGFSQPYSVFQVLVAYKVIKKNGAWYTVPPEWVPNPGSGEWKVQGEETVIAKLETDLDWMTRMENKARELVENWSPAIDTDDFDIDPTIDPDTGEPKDTTIPEETLQ